MIKHLQKVTTAIILTVPVCFFFIYSYLFYSFQKTQKSLYFTSEDIVQILEFSEAPSRMDAFFYYSPNILVYNLSTTKINEIFESKEFIERVKESSDIEITFSASELQDQFVTEIIQQNKNETGDKSHYKTLMGKMKVSSVKGKICFFKDCTDTYIAIKTRPKLSKKEEILAWR